MRSIVRRMFRNRKVIFLVCDAAHDKAKIDAKGLGPISVYSRKLIWRLEGSTVRYSAEFGVGAVRDVASF